MGKAIKQDALAQTIGTHYKIVEFEVKFEKSGAGANCKVMINTKQAVAGVAYDEKSKSITPSKEASGDIAKKAHEIAAVTYALPANDDKEIPKQLTAETIRGG